jgi:hypothetical protein
MVQGCNSVRLALEPFRELFVRNLDRDGAIEARIAGFVNFSHAAGANGRDDLIRAQASSGRQRHGILK